MKRVKIMLSGILMLAVVAGALAFKAKSTDVCAYATTSNTTLASISAPIVHPTNVPVQSITLGGLSTQYATTFIVPVEGCPATTFAAKSKTLRAEQ